MAVSRVIEVSFGRSSVALVRIDTAYFYNNGIIFKPTDIELPTSYQVHWADSPQASSTLETIGTAEGAPIPDDLWNRSRVIYGWIYLHPTNDSSVTGYEVRIYKNVRAGLPDGTEPTPAEQSTIDQLIGALNSAVAQTAEDVESASQSAQSAEQAKDTAEVYVGTAKGYAEQADASATASANSALASAQRANASAESATQAQGYANSASASAQSASTSASNASASANTASSKATEASTSAQTASQKATEASQSASQALGYKTDAESAKTASQTAQGLAESARDSAITAKNDAESARDDAVQAKEDAESAVASIGGALAEKAPVITDTASGSIASFSDGADGLPLKSLIVDINPIQDLSHGDPSPENICPISGWTEIDVNHSDADMTNPTTLTINLGQTVYGGKLDVVSGVMRVDMAMVDLGTLTWNYVASSSFNFRASELIGAKPPANAVVKPNAICSILPVLDYTAISAPVDGITIIFATSAQAGKVWAHSRTYTDATAFKSAVTGQTLVYELAEPIEIQLDSHTLNSLYGVNNLWADSGDTTCVYRADTKLFIERLTAPDSADMVADANITSGKYFMVGNSLYKATANIANGGQIIVGTNAVRKSLSEALNEINA